MVDQHQPSANISLTSAGQSETSRSDLFQAQLECLGNLVAPLWVFDVDNARIVWANQQGLKFWDAESCEDLQQRDLSVGMSSSVHARLLQICLDCRGNARTYTEQWTVYPQGEPHTAEITLSSITLADNRAALLIELVKEITDVTSETLHSAQALMHTSAMISLYDETYRLTYSNPAARAVQNCPRPTLAQNFVFEQDYAYILSELDRVGECDVEMEVTTVNGPVWHSMNIQLSTNATSGEQSVLVSATDVTQRRLAQQQAHVLAYTDSLTGLPNRIALLEELSRLCQNRGQEFTLLFIDLDRFKLINDTLGHQVGDRLLTAVARRLRSCVNDDVGSVNRLGGDEFVVVLHTPNIKRRVDSIARRIHEHLSAPMAVDGHQLRITPSIGICHFPDDGLTTTVLMQHADLAMYSAKAGNTGICYFDDSMGKNTEDRLRLENDLVVALRSQQFEVYYQPKICAKTDTVTGMEALVRWLHPQRGMVNPLDFIGVAEETGLISQIGQFVMIEAMQQQKKWQDLGHEICVSINISPVQFASSELTGFISDALTETCCEPANIEFEITESMLLGDADIVFDTLDTLSNKGVKLALDDFGTGYSNLAYLQKYPLSCLKVDKTFLQDMQQTAILEMILRMGKTLGLSVVAEGVETIDQINWLKERNCDELQGFFFSKPMPADKATDYLEDFKPTFISVNRAA